MSILLYILLGALTFISLIALIGLFLPQQVKVERSIIIEAEPAIIFDEIADFENFVTWNTWTKKDPAIKQWFQFFEIFLGFHAGPRFNWGTTDGRVDQAYGHLEHLVKFSAEEISGA